MATNGARTAAVQEPQVPPQNLDAEESVLGAMMLSPSAIAAVSEVFSPDGREFYRESHARIYRAALALYAKGEPVDAITLVDELDERGELEEVGGKVRVHELAALVPASANAGHYAQIVKEAATLRGLIRVGGEIARLGWERPGETPEPGRPRRADPLRPLPGEGHLGVQPYRDAPEGELRAHHAALRVGRGRHGHPVRLPRSRPDHVRLPGGEPRRHRRPPEHGQVRARPRRGREPRRPQGRSGRPLHPRDVEIGGDPAA